MKNRIMISVFFGGVILNISGYFLVDFIKDYYRINIFLDSTGTILAGAVLGPFLGGIAGLLTNLILGVIHNPVNIPFGIVNLLIGVTAGLVSRFYGFRNLKSLIICIISVALVTSISGATVAWFVFGGATGARIDLNLLSLINAGYQIFYSSFLVRLPVNFVDKGISGLAAYLIFRSIKPAHAETASEKE